MSNCARLCRIGINLGCMISALMLMTSCVPSSTTPQKKSDEVTAAQIHVQLALNYLQQGDVRQANLRLNRAYSLDPKSAQVNAAYGYYYQTVGETKLAERYYKDSIRYGHGAGEYHNSYGAFLCQENRFAEAETEFMRAVEDRDYVNTSQAYENAGLCALKAEQTDAAYEYFQKALNYDPYSATSLLEMALLESERNRFSQARAYLERYESRYGRTDAFVITVEKIH